MRPLKTTFYDTASGVEFTLRWENEKQFLAARQFLNQLTGGFLNTHGDADYCVLHNAEQRDAMYDYRQEFRRAKRT